MPHFSISHRVRLPPGIMIMRVGLNNRLDSFEFRRDIHVDMIIGGDIYQVCSSARKVHYIGAVRPATPACVRCSYLGTKHRFRPTFRAVGYTQVCLLRGCTASFRMILRGSRIDSSSPSMMDAGAMATGFLSSAIPLSEGSCFSLVGHWH